MDTTINGMFSRRMLCTHAIIGLFIFYVPSGKSTCSSDVGIFFASRHDKSGAHLCIEITNIL